MLILQAVLVASVIMDFFPPIQLVEYENNYFCVILPFDFMLLLLFFYFFPLCREAHHSWGRGGYLFTQL